LTTTALKLHILGRRQLLYHENPITVSRKEPKKVLEFLDILICKGPRGIGREAAADLLWPETEGDRAQQNMKTTLHRLKKLLRCEHAISTDGRLALSPQYCWVDAWYIESLFDEANKSDNAIFKLKVMKEAISSYCEPVGQDAGVSVLRIPYLNRLRTKYEYAVKELENLSANRL
jgi:LuxR family transcriptional regulator, maltose regulon positive regulatory protein